MNESHTTTGWKQRAVKEMTDYVFTFVYMAIFFGSFTWYRRLILESDQIVYLHYGIAVIQALILAKVVLIGRALKLDRGLFKDLPLIVPTFYKSFVFTIFVALFSILEHVIGGVIKGKGIAGGFEEFLRIGENELLAESLVVFTAFLPFFAFEELERVLGEGKLHKLFFGGRSSDEQNHSTKDLS